MDSPVRVGDTVRRAQRENTGLVQQVLRHLEDAGVAWAPRALGIDEREAARKSVRHQALANRGDHLTLRSMHSWAISTEYALRIGFGAGSAT
jgi:hypothetical protein